MPFRLRHRVRGECPAFGRREPGALGIERDMADHRLTGLSVAVFDNYGSIRTQTYGAKSVAGEPVRETTAFSTASISKPVTAMLCLILAEEGRIDLDAPIAQSLTRWQLPHSDVPGAG